jgi:ParB/RepB/Spo0J family partition protein
MASKLFGGTNLSEIARTVKERAAPSPFDRPTAARPIAPAAELAIAGRAAPADLVRENIYSIDPKRARPWKFHDRTPTWYTKERCQDLIDSIPKDGQREPALARKLNDDPNFDYEIVYGMRRRFACEFVNTKLKIRVLDIGDAQAAVLMNIENAKRKDVTPMERALSFQSQLDGKVFSTQDALADAMGLSKGQVAKMVRAAQVVRIPNIGALFPDLSVVPVEQAYKLSTMIERPGAKEVILQAAQNLARKGKSNEEGARPPGEILRTLISSLDRSRKLEPLKREYSLGSTKRVLVTRNPKGKVTIAFPHGLGSSDRDGIVDTLDKILRDLA